jgi:hypothetical protein
MVTPDGSQRYETASFGIPVLFFADNIYQCKKFSNLQL